LYILVNGVGHTNDIHANSTDLRGSLPIFEVFYRLPILDVFLPILKTPLKSTCDVNLLSKLSIILKEWRVMNNVDRGGARV
jgi:hypothetical protein